MVKTANQEPGARYRSGVWLAAAVLLAVVVANSLVSMHATRALIRSNEAVEHTRIVTDELDGAVAAMLNVETGERGYLYTGDRTYLEPYELGKPELESHLNRVASLTADNPRQQKNLARTRVLVQDAMAFFGEAVALTAAGKHQAAKQLVLTTGGKARMDAVREALGEMKAEELRLLASRSAEAKQSELYLQLAIPFSHALTALLVVVAGLLVGRDLRKRVETARQLRDLADREHQARHEAEAAHQRTESVLSGISEMFLLLDRDWKIAYVNEQTVRVTGKPRQALVGEKYWDAFPENLGTMVEESFRRAMEAQVPEALEVQDRAHGKWFRLNLYPSALALTVFAQDITELKQAQAALVRTEKLAAVGRMASSVAHEINNPLEAVTNLIWIARNEPSASETVRKHLGAADEELRRVAHITKQSLGFYRDAAGPATLEVPELLNGVLRLYASRLASRRISLRTDYDGCEMFGYGGELRQLFSNLCANAVDAAPAGGRIAVKVSRSHAWGNATESGVRVTIADDGCGIAAEHLSSVFEPFFTTKNATGTGLGLWVAKQIVEKHGGTIAVRSKAKPDRHYTVFSVFFPARGSDREHEFAAAG
ncbi:MAG: CHASE3 domain-containing protein [Terriglobales bacterium]